MKAVPRHVIQDVDKLETIQLGPVFIHVPQIDCINSELFNINDIKLYNDCKSKIVEMHKLLNISIPTINISIPTIHCQSNHLIMQKLQMK
jgi:hypothetical protein